MSLTSEQPELSAREILNRRQARHRRRQFGMVDKQDFIPHRELASISATHARIDYVLNQLENLVPPEALSNPMVRMFLTFVKESKKDLRRMPEDFIISLSRPFLGWLMVIILFLIPMNCSRYQQRAIMKRIRNQTNPIQMIRTRNMDQVRIQKGNLTRTNNGNRRDYPGKRREGNCPR